MSTWIFLRGLTRESAHWGTFPQDFRQVVPQVRVILLDLPGNGCFHRQSSPLSVAGMVQACRAELARQDVQAPVSLLAMSLGAMVAVEWARVAPAEVAACVLINTSVRPFSPFHQRLLPHNYPTLLRLALTGAPPEATERTVLRLTSNHARHRLQVLADWVAARYQRPVSARNAVRQLIAAARYRAPEAAPLANILLLASQHDHLVDSRCSQALAAAWNRPLALHPSAGHDLPLDDPGWVAGQVRDWLADGTP